MKKDLVCIVNWMLTRRCPLKCFYCSITKDYKGIPDEYPKMKYYYENEMKTDEVIDALSRIHAHNPNCFHIFYGGECLLREDMKDIVKFCHANKIFYTIITSNTDTMVPLLDKLINDVGYLEGLTCSADPIISKPQLNNDRYNKSYAAVKRFANYKDVAKDRVAEITVDSKSLPDLYDLLRVLTDLGVSSSLTFIDIAKDEYHDFAGTNNPKLLVQKEDALPVVNQIIENLEKGGPDKLTMHMDAPLLRRALEGLPSSYKCHLDENVHNLTVDADGSIRLCERIRGIITPTFKVKDYFTKDGVMSQKLKDNIGVDYKRFCKCCNWTCPMMSQMVLEDENKVADLVHFDRRK